MNLIELQRALGQLRLGGMAAVLETRLRQAQAEAMAPIDLISCLVADELTRRSDRLLERRRKQAAFRDPQRTLDNFDFSFNPKMNRSLVFDLATCTFIGKREDALFLGPGGTGKSHLAQAIGSRRGASWIGGWALNTPKVIVERIALVKRGAGDGTPNRRDVKGRSQSGFVVRVSRGRVGRSRVVRGILPELFPAKRFSW
jgi:hypothetical protein